jgi:hypothetical protein
MDRPSIDFLRSRFIHDFGLGRNLKNDEMFLALKKNRLYLAHLLYYFCFYESNSKMKGSEIQV